MNIEIALWGIAFLACFSALIVLLCSIDLVPREEMDDWIKEWDEGIEDIGDKKLKDFL